jgi:hypothetical protein
LSPAENIVLSGDMQIVSYVGQITTAAGAAAEARAAVGLSWVEAAATAARLPAAGPGLTSTVATDELGCGPFKWSGTPSATHAVGSMPSNTNIAFTASTKAGSEGASCAL